jgi:hypothetical protein
MVIDRKTEVLKETLSHCTYPMDCTGREPEPPQSELGIGVFLQLTSVLQQKRNKEKLSERQIYIRM